MSHLADLAFNGLRSYVKEKLEGHLFTSVNQVLDRALAQENKSKELAKSKSDRPNIHFLNNNVVMYVLLNLHGHLRIRHILALLSSRFIEISETRSNLLLMSRSVIKYLMSY
jgi:hypothetical protein